MTLSSQTAIRPVRTPVTLGRAIAGFVFLGALVAGAFALTLAHDRVRAFNADALAAAVTARANGVNLAFARALHEEWMSVQALARRIGSGNTGTIGNGLTFIVNRDERVSWAGYASIDGIVRMASNNMLAGVDVSQRPWFQRGLEGPFAGDVHEAVLLAKLLPAQAGGEPPRFLDLATPVLDGDNNPIGVLGFHINYKWARDFVREQALALAIDVFIVDRDGKVVIASDDSDYSELNLQSMRTATAGTRAAAVETWPNGQRYFTAVIPQIAYKNLPSFGWRMVARIKANALEQTDRAFSTDILVTLAMQGLALVLLTALFVRLFGKPFADLSRNAVQIANGEEVYPYESTRTAELARLSAALARLQGKASGGGA